MKYCSDIPPSSVLYYKTICFFCLPKFSLLWLLLFLSSICQIGICDQVTSRVAEADSATVHRVEDFTAGLFDVVNGVGGRVPVTVMDATGNSGNGRGELF